MTKKTTCINAATIDGIRPQSLKHLVTKIDEGRLGDILSQGAVDRLVSNRLLSREYLGKRLPMSRLRELVNQQQAQAAQKNVSMGRKFVSQNTTEALVACCA